MRKLSQINEGLWKDTVNKSKSGEARGEETNIYTMPEGDDLEDLPFIIADKDFFYKGKNEFTYKEALELQPLFEKYGWRLPTYDDAMLISQKCKLKVVDKDLGYIVGPRKRNPRVTVESPNNHYWVTSPHAQYPFYPYLVVSLFAKLIFLEDRQYIAPRDTKSIRLVKDKKRVNEGLWKSGVERAKSGEERIEDRFDSNIKSLNPVDLGFNFLIADDTLEIEGNRTFDLGDVRKYRDIIAKYGWRYMTIEECRLLAYNSRFRIVNGDGVTNQRELLKIESKKNKNSVFYDITDCGAKKFYWIDPDGGVTRTIMVDLDDGIKMEPSVGRLFHNYEIILVKDK